MVTSDAYRWLWDHHAVLDRIRGRRDPGRRARLRAAAAGVDRELAANLELAAMFDQTHQAVVFENGEFARHRTILASEVPEVFPTLAGVYEGIPATESAMERRGPAHSLRPEDRALIETWEGDLRDVQRSLRQAARAEPPSLWASLVARRRGGRRTGR